MAPRSILSLSLSNSGARFFWTRKLPKLSSFLFRKPCWHVESPHLSLLLLMAEILHHLGCKNPTNNGRSYLSTGVGFQPSTLVIFGQVEFTSFFILSLAYPAQVRNTTLQWGGEGELFQSIFSSQFEEWMFPLKTLLIALAPQETMLPIRHWANFRRNKKS